MPRRAGIAILLLVLVGAGAYLVKQKYKPSTPPLTTRIVIAQAGDFFLYAPLYVALDAGFFKDQFLDVSIVTTGGDDKTWAAVISNSAQFGVADPTFIVASTQRGQPGKVVASIVNGVPFWGVTFRPDLKPLKDASGLRNLKVATFPSPSTAYVLQEKMFKDAGLPPDIVQGAFGSLLTMVRAKRADVALELEPNVSQAVADGASILYSMKDVYGDFAITGLTATPEFLERNASAAAAVTCGLQKALDVIHKQPDRTLTILRHRFPDIKEEVSAAALRRVIDGGIIPSTLTVSQTAWQKAVDLRISVKDVAGPAPFSQFIDDSFADKAAQSCRLK
jgi:NitT/TauT family transport system substrate-binding protein